MQIRIVDCDPVNLKHNKPNPNIFEDHRPDPEAQKITIWLRNAAKKSRQIKLPVWIGLLGKLWIRIPMRNIVARLFLVKIGQSLFSVSQKSLYYVSKK